MTAIVWFKQDLRLEDNPALETAIKRGVTIPVYILDPTEPLGGASKWWLHHSLASLAEDLKKIGLQLILRQGDPQHELAALAQAAGATHIFWNRRYEPWAIQQDPRTESALIGLGLRVETFNSALLYEPWTIANQQGKPFQVFTPFWRSCLADRSPSAAVPAPHSARGYLGKIASKQLQELDLLPRIPWDKGIAQGWQPGEVSARKRLHSFIGAGLDEYPELRDRPDRNGISRMSPHLHFGEISPRVIWREVSKSSSVASAAYLRQLGWREFAHHLLYHFPRTLDQPLRQEFTAFPWEERPDWLRAWQTGKTGYPIVDAGMRELWTTGWMHNRVRMIVGSFLVKDLMLPWQAGASWFWDTLVDADGANNTLGWQWIAGCGADAAPYFRIFNPVTQGQKFDPQGLYVRKWVPEIARLSDKWIHCPWMAPTPELWGVDYPGPIVDHGQARLKALAAFSELKCKTNVVD